MPHKDVIHLAFIAAVHFLKDDQVVAIASDLLHSLQNDSAAIAEVVGDDDLCKAAMTFCLENFNHGMWTDVPSAAGD